MHIVYRRLLVRWPTGFAHAHRTSLHAVMDTGTASSSATPYRQQRVTLNNTPNQVSVVVNAVPGNDAVVVRPPGVPAHAITRRGVTVTPLSTHISCQGQSTKQKVVGKVLLKAVARSGKKSAKTFTLRNINVSDVDTCSLLKSLIRAQLREDISAYDFDVGYLNGASVVSIRNEDDLAEIWSSLLKGDKVTLWCNGLGRSSGGSRREKADSDSDDSDIVSKPKRKARDREDRVQEVLESLKKEHGDKFTTMQYRIWSEMVAGGMHGSLEEPPATSMFLRAGGVPPPRRLQLLMLLRVCRRP